MNKYIAPIAVILSCLLVSSCSSTADSKTIVTNCDPDLSSKDVVFTPNPEWTSGAGATSSVDVNLGNTPEVFVQAAYEQINGVMPSPTPSIVTTQINNLKNISYYRRIDVVHALMVAASATSMGQTYSDPWQSQPAFTTAPCKALKRDVGAVLMFFFNCAGGVNCGMDWANTHTHGMDTPDALYGFGASSTGIYNSSTNAGFFYRELLDARHAGLQFFLANAYGPDLKAPNGSLTNLVSALNQIHTEGYDNTVKMALMDDTWGWGNYGTTPWNVKPILSTPGTNNVNTVTAASKIYLNKWKPFFSAIPRQDWYTFQGRPLIYFYNAGTLQPSLNAPSVIQEMKDYFYTDFGVQPWVVVDVGFANGSDISADSQFTWSTFNMTDKKSRSTLSGVTLDHAMVKWDPIGRDTSGDKTRIANSGDKIIKGGELLQQILDGSEDADILVLGTWNDLGEGTGINRSYDYYYQGNWLPPNYFMNKIRHSQAHSP